MMQTLREFSALLDKDPSIWNDPNLDFLRTSIQNAENCEDEEAPPDMDEPDDKSSARSWVQKAQLLFDDNSFSKALEFISKALELNPNSASALRLKSETQFKLRNYKDAYFTMCDAQRIDYDDGYDILQQEMKEAYHKSKDVTEISTEDRVPQTTLPNMPNPSGMNFQEMMNNPQFMQMAQTMMGDPNIQKMMGNMFKQ